MRKNSDGVYDSNEREGRPKKELVHFNPVALSMFRRNASAHGEVDLLKEVQGSEGQTTVQDAAEEYEIIYSKGDVVALKHNYKRYIIPFFLTVLLKDLRHNGDAFLEDHMGLRLKLN